MTERIVITGMGTVNPIGLTVEETWQNAIAGVSGVGPITLFDPSEWLVEIACEVKNFDPTAYMAKKETRRRDRFEQFAIVAAQQALQQSGLDIQAEDPWRVGVVIASAVGGLKSLQDAIFTLKDSGPRKVNPFVIPMLMANGASGMVAIDNQIKGPNFSVASACASSNDAMGMAWMMLRAGVVDAVLAGGSEATITPIGIGAFDRIGAMSRNNQDYSMTPQPFDLNRDGLVMGEGAGVLVLETESHAKARGAQIFAEFAGYAATSDAYHVTAPDAEGSSGAQAMRMAVRSAGLNLDQVGYINAHGTGTKMNDAAETKAIKSVFGDLATRLAISSTKSMTGHMMGATGAVEAILCAQAVREGILPPTIHYQTFDPDCDLDIIPNQARETQVEVAISNAFGFGGHNAVIAIRRYN